MGITAILAAIRTILSGTVKVNVVGGVSASSLADVLLTDTTGALFIGRDNGTTITFYNLNTSAVYTPVGTILVADTLATGTDATGVTPPTGAVGMRGWLSGIYEVLLGTAQGSTGLDFSANQPTIPHVGAAFGGSGPYANYVLVATVPAANHNNIDIENISGAQIAVVRDDGTVGTGSAPNHASVFALSGGSASGGQGGAWSSTTFKGRIQIYAASSSAIVTVMVD